MDTFINFFIASYIFWEFKKDIIIYNDENVNNYIDKWETLKTLSWWEEWQLSSLVWKYSKQYDNVNFSTEYTNQWWFVWPSDWNITWWEYMFWWFASAFTNLVIIWLLFYIIWYIFFPKKIVRK